MAKITLSDRESEVMGLLAKGKTRREIAFHLGISRYTVDNYCNMAFSKLGAMRVGDAIANWVRQNSPL